MIDKKDEYTSFCKQAHMIILQAEMSNSPVVKPMIQLYELLSQTVPGPISTTTILGYAQEVRKFFEEKVDTSVHETSSYDRSINSNSDQLDVDIEMYRHIDCAVKIAKCCTEYIRVYKYPQYTDTIRILASDLSVASKIELFCHCEFCEQLTTDMAIEAIRGYHNNIKELSERIGDIPSNTDIEQYKTYDGDVDNNIEKIQKYKKIINMIIGYLSGKGN